MLQFPSCIYCKQRLSEFASTVIPAMVQRRFFDIIKQLDHKYATPPPWKQFYVFFATAPTGVLTAGTAWLLSKPNLWERLHIYGKTKALHHCGNYCTRAQNKNKSAFPWESFDLHWVRFNLSLITLNSQLNSWKLFHETDTAYSKKSSLKVHLSPKSRFINFDGWSSFEIM